VTFVYNNIYLEQSSSFFAFCSPFKYDMLYFLHLL